MQTDSASVAHFYQNHSYVKAPVEGRRGIKNGVMRIGKDELPFKEWLRGLRDERWQEAWKNFWQNESFVSNVGF